MSEVFDRGGQAKVRRPVDAGPPLPVVASITAALVVAGIVVPLLASGGQAYPSPLDGGQTLQSYVASHPEALQWAALFQFAASIPLAVLTASMVARLHALGVRAAGPMIALVGGGLASAAMALSACGQWMLSRMPADAPPPLLHAVHDLVFITGGPWQVVASGLLLAGIAVSAAFHRLLPRPVWITGVALAVVCELATLTFATTTAAYLLPVGRFGGIVWLVAAAVQLPRERPRRPDAAPNTSPAASTTSAGKTTTGARR
jgi:hypothetical protein